MGAPYRRPLACNARSTRGATDAIICWAWGLDGTSAARPHATSHPSTRTPSRTLCGLIAAADLSSWETRPGPSRIGLGVSSPTTAPAVTPTSPLSTAAASPLHHWCFIRIAVSSHHLAAPRDAATSRPVWPGIARAWKQPVEEREDQRAARQGPQQGVTPIPDELHIPGSEGHEPGKQEASQTSIGRRFWIGNHEKG